MSEVWKAVVGFEGLYEVSDMGRVRSLERIVLRKGKAGAASWKPVRERILAAIPSSDGYPIVHLRRPGGSRRARVHILVAQAFIGPTPPGQEVRHRNGKRDDPALLNLRYGTRAENMADASAHGTITRANNGFAKLSEADVVEIKRRLAAGEYQRVIAADFGIGQPNVSAIKNGRSWS